MAYYHVAIANKSGKIRWAFAFNMSKEQVDERIVLPFKKQLPFMCGKRVIQPSDIEFIKISKTDEKYSETLRKSGRKRTFRKVMSRLVAEHGEEDEHIDEWYVIDAGKDVTGELIGEISLPKEISKARTLFANLITHPKIKQASQNQFKNEQYRLAVLDAMISLEVMIKEKAKYPADNKGKELSGVPLMHKVFDPDNPILSWRKDTRQIDRDELEGYKHIFAGAMQGIRDPKAHAIFQISPMRALKLLTLATLLAELVDASEYVTRTPR